MANQKTELYSTDALVPAWSSSATAFHANRVDPQIIDLGSLQQSLVNCSTLEPTRLGQALQNFGIVLLDLRTAQFVGLSKDNVEYILSGRYVDVVCDEIFSDPSQLLSHFRAFPENGLESGFYSFTLNSTSGGIRGANLSGEHDGLPTSLIWNHSAQSNPSLPSLASAQSQLDRVVVLYEQVLDVIVDALSVFFEDHAECLKRLVGRKHHANHIKIIRSRASLRTIESDEQPLINRHRTHIDHCALTLNPPSRPIAENGALFFYLGRSTDRPQWLPLFVPEGHVAIFVGIDLGVFTAGSRYQFNGLPHQVVASSEQVEKDRSSLLYRLIIDPDSNSLQKLDGSPFSFHQVITKTGQAYYEEVTKHRKGY